MSYPNIERIRPLGKQRVDEVFREFAEVAEHGASFGTHVVHWCSQEHTTAWRDEALTKSILFAELRYFLVLLDPFPQLLRQKQTEVAHLSMRVLLETTFNLLFMLQADVKERTAAFAFAQGMADILRRDLYDPSTEVYQNFDRLHRLDLLLGPGPADVAPDVEEMREQNRQEHSVMKDSFPDLYSKFEHLKESQKRKLKWYTLISDVKNIHQLATAVNLGATYEMFYSRYSGKIHSTDIMKGNMEFDAHSNSWNNVPLRSVQGGSELRSAREIVAITLRCAQLVFMQYAATFLPHRVKDVKLWSEEHDALIARIWQGR